jgi:hypothetical protein
MSKCESNMSWNFQIKQLGSEYCNLRTNFFGIFFMVGFSEVPASTPTKYVKIHIIHFFDFGSDTALTVFDRSLTILSILRYILRVIVWIFSRRVVFNSRPFGTLCLFHLYRRVDMKCAVSTHLWRWNRHSVPKRRLLNTTRLGTTQILHATFRTLRKFEIKNR